MTFGITQAEGVTAVPGGFGGLGSSYGSFQDYTTQTGSTTVGVPFTFDTDDFNGAGGITISESSKIAVPYDGIYNLQFSGQFSSDDTATTDIFVWVKKNGTTDIVGSTGLIGMLPRKNPGQPSHCISGWNYFLSLNATDYIQLYWLKGASTITLTTFAASVSPAYPSTASIIATINKVG